MGIIGLFLLIAGIVLFAFGFPLEILGAVALVAGSLICLVAVILKRRTGFAIAGLIIISIGIVSQLPAAFRNETNVPPEVSTQPEAPPPPAGVQGLEAPFQNRTGGADTAPAGSP